MPKSRNCRRHAMTPDLSQKPAVTPFFDERSNTISYVVQEPDGPACAVIDAVMDIDYAAGPPNFHGADAIIATTKAAASRSSAGIPKRTPRNSQKLSTLPVIHAGSGIGL